MVIKVLDYVMINLKNSKEELCCLGTNTDSMGKILPLKFTRFLSCLIRRLIIDHNFCKEVGGRSHIILRTKGEMWAEWQ